jgi:hypothetical protein
MGAIMRLELQISKHAVTIIVDAAVLCHRYYQISGIEFLRSQKNQRAPVETFCT